jgi:peptide/nickel transport system substrate-binding protein
MGVLLRGPTEHAARARSLLTASTAAAVGMIRSLLRHGAEAARRDRAALLLSSALAMHASAACMQQPSPDGDAQATVTIGVPQNRQPGQFGIDQIVDTLSQEGLLGYDLHGRPRPALATAWASSPDGLSLKLSLRAGVQFHDGSPLDAAAAAGSINASLRARDRSPAMAEVLGVEAIGPLELSVSLRHPSALLFEELGMAITREAADGHLVATGPFQTVSRSEDEVHMQANDNYHGGRPAVGRVVLKPFASMRTAWAAMMRGELDFLHDFGHEAAEFARRESSVEVSSFLRPFVYAIVFNMQHPVLADPVARRALGMGVDREEIVEQALRGRGVAAEGPVWHHHWAIDTGQQRYGHNPDRAAALLSTFATAAPAGGRPGRLTFTCLVRPEFARHEHIALIVQKQLFDIGVDMRLEEVPAANLLDRLQAGDFDAALLEVVTGPRLSFQYLLWHSPTEMRSWNFWDYRSDTVDAALDDMRRAPDDETLRSAVARYQRDLHCDPPGIFLAWGETLQAVSRRIDVPAVPGQDLLRTLQTWRSRWAYEERRP